MSQAVADPWYRFWRWKGTWDIVEIVAVCVAGIGGVALRIAPKERQSVAATTTIGAVMVVAVAKAVSKFIDLRNARKAALAEQQRQAELDRLRARAADQGRRTVGALVRDLWEQYFQHVDQAERYKSRVTLFRCVGPDEQTGRGKHLAIYVREGRYPDSRCTWPIDDNEPDGCRGVAARIWFHEVMLWETAECDWPDDGDPHRKADYARSLKIAVEEAERLNVKSRQFTGALVEVLGRKWGVLLLDSCALGQISSATAKKGLLSRYAKTMGKVLSEMDP